MPPAPVQGRQAQPEQPLGAGQQGQQKVGIFFLPGVAGSPETRREQKSVAALSLCRRGTVNTCPRPVRSCHPTRLRSAAAAGAVRGPAPRPRWTARTPGNRPQCGGMLRTALCSGRSLRIKQCQRNPRPYLTFYSGWWDCRGTEALSHGRRRPYKGALFPVLFRCLRAFLPQPEGSGPGPSQCSRRGKKSGF